MYIYISLESTVMFYLKAERWDQRGEHIAYFFKKIETIGVRMFPDIATGVSTESSAVLLFLHCLSTQEASVKQGE